MAQTPCRRRTCARGAAGRAAAGRPPPHPHAEPVHALRSRICCWQRSHSCKGDAGELSARCATCGRRCSIPAAATHSQATPRDSPSCCTCRCCISPPLHTCQPGQKHRARRSKGAGAHAEPRMRFGGMQRHAVAHAGATCQSFATSVSPISQASRQSVTVGWAWQRGCKSGLRCAKPAATATSTATTAKRWPHLGRCRATCRSRLRF